MKKIICLLMLASGLAAMAADTNTAASNQEVMTSESFHQIVGLPADSTPLSPPLAQVPFWTNAVISNVTTYASGKVFTGTMTQTARTVGGKYVVFTVLSESSQQPINAILTCDPRTSSLKTYGMYNDGHGGEILTEALLDYDFKKKTYTMTSSYGDGFKETTIGSDTDAEGKAETFISKNDAFLLKRATVIRPAGGSK